MQSSPNNPMQTNASHRFPLILAITLHALLFLFLFAHFSSPNTHNLQLQPDVDIIKAVAVTPAEVTAQITRLRAQEQQKQRAIEQAAQKAQQEAAQKRAALEAQRQQEAAAKQAEQLAALKQAEAAATQEQQAAEQKVLQEKQANEVALQKKAEKVAEAKKAEAEKTKQEELKKQQQAKKDAEKKKQQKSAEALKLAQQKELDSQIAAEKKELEAARTAENQSEIDKYSALMKHTIQQNWIVPDGLNPTLSCKLSIQLKSDGTVVSVNIVRSSGNAALDNSARLAVFKSSPLPVPADKELFDSVFKQFNVTVSPQD